MANIVYQIKGIISFFCFEFNHLIIVCQLHHTGCAVFIIFCVQPVKTSQKNI